ncbi:ataxin-10 isoform X1 [Drosophila kikkawai]|uniref:Ataxin-10 n=1 Tax=Drosophila kikkawai TaxID=30033 RepID=A0A6P4HWA4_DROKI|nr:ataxin-10 [Drosophila kikkawai]
MEHAHSDTSELIQRLVGLSVTENAEEVAGILKNLRLLLTQSQESQDTLARSPEFSSFLDAVAFNPLMRTEHRLAHNLSLQVLANSVVNNELSQRLTWNQHGSKIAEQAYAAPLGSSNNVLLMIMYNIFLNGRGGLISDLVALQTCLRLWRALNEAQCTYNFEYLHFFLEHFIVQNGRACVACYQKLDTEDRIAFLDYVAHYLRENSPNGEVTLFLLQHFAKEFRLKSDCILRETLKLKHELHPREVHTLLRIIASVSGSEKYGNVYATDQSLFINVSSLLRCVVAAGKEPDGGGLDKPMTKLEEVALTSGIDAGYEKKVSYELKTLLVRCCANLLYENKENKGYCLDTQLLPALLECTTMDARNPLMREWSILAIRNACINCPEAQQVIAGLTMQGSAPNDILSELNLDMGALRISDKRQ